MQHGPWEPMAERTTLQWGTIRLWQILALEIGHFTCVWTNLRCSKEEAQVPTMSFESDMSSGFGPAWTREHGIEEFWSDWGQEFRCHACLVTRGQAKQLHVGNISDHLEWCQSLFHYCVGHMTTSSSTCLPLLPGPWPFAPQPSAFLLPPQPSSWLRPPPSLPA